MNLKTSFIRSKYDLDDFQSKSFDYIDKKINVLVSAPTGSGKTTIADYAIENAKQSNPNAKIIYTCPIKALCNEKYRDMVLFWGSNPYNYTIGLMTGDIIINPYRNTKSSIEPSGDIVVMTTEVLQKLMESTELTELTKSTESIESTESSKLTESTESTKSTESIELTELTCEKENSKKHFNPDVIIFDEAHYINDDSRGHVWEKCIIGSLLNTDSLLIMLSATIGNINQIKTWLNTICPSKPTEIVLKTERPVPLRQYFIDCTKSRIFKRITAENDEEKRKVSSDPDPESYEILELSDLNYHRVKRYWDKLEEYGYTESFEIETVCNLISSNPNLGIPAIIFVLSKKKCEQLAQSIKSNYINEQTQTEILKFYDSNLKEFKDCIQYQELRKVISRGIGYHHSGLIPKIREVIEFLIKNKLIKLVFATETFAVGLNFPVKTVVMTSLTKPTEKGFRFLSPSEYKQMAGRAGRRFIDTFGNVIILLFNHKSKQKNSYPSWNEINNITNGPTNNVESKYIIEPNYILKNITSGLDKLISRNSFKYYNMKIEQKNFDIPIKFSKLFEIEKKIIEFAKSGITFKDKNYLKLMSKFSKPEQKEYHDFLIKFNSQSMKNELEQHIDLEKSIVDFLFENNFIKKTHNNLTGWDFTSKGIMAIEFNEINSVIFSNHQDKIMENSNNIIPILSMFIDDGIKIQQDEIIKWNEIEPEILFWEDTMKLYSKFIFKYPKWTYWPKNYLIMKDWIKNHEISLDQIVASYNIDLGLFIKMLIKMYQIVDELLGKLDKLNMSGLTDKLMAQKDLLIRYPLKIDSLYVNM